LLIFALDMQASVALSGMVFV
jgi:hypothetical protein